MALGHSNSEKLGPDPPAIISPQSLTLLRFLVLWNEPSLPNNTDVDSAYYSLDSTSRDKRDTFAKVRRFVIIKPMDGHCICLLIPPCGNVKLDLANFL